MNEGSNKIISGRKNLHEQIDTFKNVLLGEVVSVQDPNYLGRIKVRVKGPANKGGDDGIPDTELAWCFPLIPKFISTQPKIKEAVYIFTFDKNRQHTDRLYLGPIISQPQQFNFDPYYTSAMAGFTFGSQSPSVSINTIPQLKGVFPDPQDISIQGRFNTDITQKNNEVVIRVGKFESSKPDKVNPFNFKFNNKTQGYFQIKNDAVISLKTDTKEERGTVTNIVSNKINLLTHKDGNPKFNLTNQDNLISDEELSRVLEEAHQLPFGDILLEYLILLKNAFFNHVHNGSTPTELITGNKLSVAEFRLKADELEKRMLSKNIRIN